MVCFCDLPLSNIDKHINTNSWEHNGETHSSKGYGKFGLGMSKDWGIRMKLNPVTYATNNSHYLESGLMANNMLSPIHKIYRHKLLDLMEKNGGNFPDQYTEEDSILLHTVDNLYQILRSNSMLLNYLKPYQDSKNGKRYYDEREWRYVILSDEGTEVEAPVLKTHILGQLDQKSLYEERISVNHMLNFQPNDIKYIIVERDEDISHVVEHMESLSDKYTEEEVNRLTARIITCRQIHEDF